MQSIHPMRLPEGVMHTATFSSSTLFDRKTGTAVFAAVSLALLLLVLGGVMTCQQATHRREISALQKTILAQRAALAEQRATLAEQEDALAVKERALAAKSSEVDAKESEIAKLQSAVSQQGSQITAQQESLASLESQSPAAHMASSDDYTDFLRRVMADGVEHFGADMVRDLLKMIWNYLFPSLAIS